MDDAPEAPAAAAAAGLGRVQLQRGPRVAPGLRGRGAADAELEMPTFGFSKQRLRNTREEVQIPIFTCSKAGPPMMPPAAAAGLMGVDAAGPPPPLSASKLRRKRRDRERFKNLP